jgi:hypothetical protein
LINAIRESAAKNLLLPPWSNRLIPFIAFAMVWLAEQLMPEQKKTTTERVVATSSRAWRLFFAPILRNSLFHVTEG